MKIFCPLYNEMPWTPFFLRSLLEYDCPIVIAEGAADTIQNDNPRSTDGTLELIQEFANSWSDRVSVYYHNRKLIRRKYPFGPRIPKWYIKYHHCWNTLENGELMVALAPDNYYSTEGIKKLKQIEKDPEYSNYYHICTSMIVFIYNFNTYIDRREPGLCGPWYNVWPCIYRKNHKYTLYPGSEILMSIPSIQRVLSSGSEILFPRDVCVPLISPSIQRANYSINDHAIVVEDIVNLHYKGVKKYESRLKRFGPKLAHKWLTFPSDSPILKTYKGAHPSLLDGHPWRHSSDCRLKPSKFDWREFLYLVQRR